MLCATHTNTCADKAAVPPVGRRACQPSGREARAPRLPGPSAKHEHQKTVWNVFGGGAAKGSPAL